MHYIYKKIYFFKKCKKKKKDFFQSLTISPSTYHACIEISDKQGCQTYDTVVQETP